MINGQILAEIWWKIKKQKTPGTSVFGYLDNCYASLFFLRELCTILLFGALMMFDQFRATVGLV